MPGKKGNQKVLVPRDHGLLRQVRPSSGEVSTVGIPGWERKPFSQQRWKLAAGFYVGREISSTITFLSGVGFVVFVAFFAAKMLVNVASPTWWHVQRQIADGIEG